MFWACTIGPGAGCRSVCVFGEGVVGQLYAQSEGFWRHIHAMLVQFFPEDLEICGQFWIGAEFFIDPLPGELPYGPVQSPCVVEYTELRSISDPGLFLQRHKEAEGRALIQDGKVFFGGLKVDILDIVAPEPKDAAVGKFLIIPGSGRGAHSDCVAKCDVVEGGPCKETFFFQGERGGIGHHACVKVCLGKVDTRA